jgi:transposase
MTKFTSDDKAVWKALESGAGAAAAIDLGDKHSEVVILDDEGEVLLRRRIRTSCVELERLFGGLPPMRIAIETGGQTNWVRRRLAAMGQPVLVGDAKRLKVIWDTHSKDDKRDALFMAEIALRWPELLNAVEPRSLDSEEGRALLRMRECLVDARVKLLNNVRGVVKSFGMRLPQSTSEAFARKAMAQIPEALREKVNPLLLAIEHMSAQIKVYDKQVLKLCNERYGEQTKRLLTVRGVGPLTALAFVLELDGDAGRLRNSRAAGALVGLRPSRKESGESKPELGVTKTGNRMLRRYLVQCAHYILGRQGQDCALQRWGLKLAGTSKRGKKRATVAVARKLAVLLHTLWRKDVDFDPGYGLEQAA